MEGSYVEKIEQSMETLTSKEQMLGKGLNMPNNATYRGARKIMNNTHRAYMLPP